MSCRTSLTLSLLVFLSFSLLLGLSLDLCVICGSVFLCTHTRVSILTQVLLRNHSREGCVHDAPLTDPNLEDFSHQISQLLKALSLKP